MCMFDTSDNIVVMLMCLGVSVCAYVSLYECLFGLRVLCENVFVNNVYVYEVIVYGLYICAVILVMEIKGV